MPEGLDLIRWGTADPQSGEYLFAGGSINLAPSHGFVVRALDGYTIGLNHYTQQYDVTKDLAAPVVISVRITLRNSRHLDIWANVQKVALQEQIPVELLTPAS